MFRLGNSERLLYERYIAFLEEQIRLLQRPLGLQPDVLPPVHGVGFEPRDGVNPNDVPIRLHMSEIEEDIEHLMSKDELTQEEADRIKKALGADLTDDLPVNPHYDD